MRSRSKRLLEASRCPERVEYIRVIMAEFSADREPPDRDRDVRAGHRRVHAVPLLHARPRARPRHLRGDLRRAAPLQLHLGRRAVARRAGQLRARRSKEFCKYFRPNIKELNDLLSYNKIFIERTANVGVLPGGRGDRTTPCSGPMLRGSGVKWDLRKNDPYSIYDKFDFEIPVGTRRERDGGGLLGPVHGARARDGSRASTSSSRRSRSFPAGDVQSAIPKRIRPRPGTSTSGPRRPEGRARISTSSPTAPASPYRVKVKSPCS